MVAVAEVEAASVVADVAADVAVDVSAAVAVAYYMLLMIMI